MLQELQHEHLGH